MFGRSESNNLLRCCSVLLISVLGISGCVASDSHSKKIQPLEIDHPVYRAISDGVYATNLICCTDEPIRAVLILYEDEARILRRVEEKNPLSPMTDKRGAIRIYDQNAHAPDLLLTVSESNQTDRLSFLLVDHPNEKGWAVYLADPVPYAVMEGSDERLYINADRLTPFPAIDPDRWMQMTPRQVIDQFGGN